MMWGRKKSVAQIEPDYQNFTLLAKDVNFKGIVSFNGTVRVDGHVEGEIHTTGMLIVGEHAVIRGVVSAGVLMNSGKINGTITAAEKIQILKPGILIGDIKTPSIAIEEGSHFHGMCDMGVQPGVEPQAVSIGRRYPNPGRSGE
jgi:cytoskeletal protein CcmA (bactofilin family)